MTILPNIYTVSFFQGVERYRLGLVLNSCLIHISEVSSKLNLSIFHQLLVS
jgi:hypothetical protein